MKRFIIDGEGWRGFKVGCLCLVWFAEGGFRLFVQWGRANFGLDTRKKTPENCKPIYL